jgi:hypothetical protein
LFHVKQDFGEYKDFEQILDTLPNVKTARDVLAYRKELDDKKKKKELSPFDQQLKGLLSVPPPKKDK